VSDVRADDQLLDELEQKFLHTIDSMAGGTSVAVNEKVHQSRMPLGANAAEALDCAVNVMKRDVKVYLVASACAAKRQKLVQPALEVAWGSPQPLRCAISLYRMRARIGRRSFRPWWREITKRGKTLWFSEYEITLGDSLRARIDRGLSESRFGIVVLSHAFFAKPWPQSGTRRTWFTLHAGRAESDFADPASNADRRIAIEIAVACGAPQCRFVDRRSRRC